jgi:hypothetical protein
MPLQPQPRNECLDCGRSPTTAEGVACRACWDLVPGDVKAQYTLARSMVAKSIHAEKRLR